MASLVFVKYISSRNKTRLAFGNWFIVMRYSFDNSSIFIQQRLRNNFISSDNFTLLLIYVLPVYLYIGRCFLFLHFLQFPQYFTPRYDCINLDTGRACSTRFVRTKRRSCLTTTINRTVSLLLISQTRYRSRRSEDLAEFIFVANSSISMTLTLARFLERRSIDGTSIIPLSILIG